MKSTVNALDWVVKKLESLSKIDDTDDINSDQSHALSIIAESASCVLDIEEKKRSLGLIKKISAAQKISSKQIVELRKKLIERHATIRSWVYQQLSRQSAANVKVEFLALSKTASPILIGHMNERGDFDMEEVQEMISDRETKISTLFSGSERKLIVARVTPEYLKQCDAALVELSPTHHVIFARSDAINMPEIVQHELGHLVDRYELDDGHDKPRVTPPPSVYAEDQREVDQDPKRVITRWVAHEMPLSRSSGALIDAGSTCLEMWNRIIEQITSGILRFLMILTNNFSVLDEYKKNMASVAPHTKVRTYGSTFDADHLAFFPVDQDEIQKQILREDFFPSHVFIGTNGIQFYPDGRISFGYHGDQPELLVKRLLFKKPTDQRIILATPKKIGDAGAMRFDITSLGDELDTSAPIYLVTTDPEEVDRERFIEQFRIFTSEAMQNKLRKLGLRFNWITVQESEGLSLKKNKELTFEPDSGRESINK